MRNAGWALAVLSLMVAPTAAAPRRAGPLRSFYIAYPAGFGLWTWEIVSVEPLGDDVRVRDLRVQSASAACPEIVVVQAAERIVPRTTVQEVAGVHVCDISQEAIHRAQANAVTPRVSYIDYLGSVETVFADCAGHTLRLVLSDQGSSDAWINFRTLKRRAPAVSALWRLGARLSAGMLPDQSHTPAPGPEALGTSLVPELRSGKYAETFDESLQRLLRDYTGPPARRDPLAEVVGRDRLPLIAFVAPSYPPIAQSARVMGDVRLRLTVDATTGAVSRIDRIADIPMLGDAAVTAVRGWTFDRVRAPREPIEVTVRFTFGCRED
jgi:TonB family protein